MSTPSPIQKRIASEMRGLDDQHLSAYADVQRERDQLQRERDQLQKELSTLKTALRPLAVRIADELAHGRPSLVAIQWFRLEPIAKALGIIRVTNPAPLP